MYSVGRKTDKRQKSNSNDPAVDTRLSATLAI